MSDDNIKDTIGIIVDVFGVYKNDESTYILDSFSFESIELFPIICEISGDEAEVAERNIDKQLMIQLIAHPLTEPEVYANEEEFKRKTKDDGVLISSESFLASPETMIIDEKEVPIPEAMITGIVKNIAGPYTFQRDDELISYYEIQIELFGITITAIIKEEKCKDIKPGNIITCIYYLCGELLTK